MGDTRYQVEARRMDARLRPGSVEGHPARPDGPGRAGWGPDGLAGGQASSHVRLKAIRRPVYDWK